MGTTPLPPLLARWMESALGGEVPAEERCTCADCVMCAPVSGPLVGEPRFHAQTRCCTFEPTLPNYAVGMLLSDDTGASPAARREIGRRIPSRGAGRDPIPMGGPPLDGLLPVGATPLGIEPSLRSSLLYRHRSPDDFGRRPDLGCPYLDGERVGLCGIWRHRTSVCATWFCQHVRRSIGFRFWSTAKAMLSIVENGLSTWCLLELGLDSAAVRRLHTVLGTPRSLSEGKLQGWVDPEGHLDASQSRRLWGSWLGREEDLYRACGALVAELGWEDVRSVCGVRLRVAEAHLRTAFQALTDARIPDTLCVGRFEAQFPAEGVAVVRTTETLYDPMVLPGPLLDALTLFDGRPNRQVLQDMEARGVDRVPPLGALVDQGLLHPPDGNDLPGQDRSAAPLTPDSHLMFFRDFHGMEVESFLLSGEGGQQILRITCGPKEVDIPDPDLIELGRRLVVHQNGFVARDALGWAPPGVTYTWDRIQELLSALLAEDVLQVVPPEHAHRA